MAISDKIMTFPGRVPGWERSLLARYFNGCALEVMLEHAGKVTELAADVCCCIGLDAAVGRFVTEAAMLHDIGVCRVHAPGIGVNGADPYIMHGIIGRKILESEGLPEHALVCERHIGVGLTVDDIRDGGLPLPHRDMRPCSIPEEIICFSDLFYSKKPGAAAVRKSPEQVRASLAGFGPGKVSVFDRWMERYGAAVSR